MHAGIGRDSRHKRRATGGKRPIVIKKRKHELGRQAAMTKIGAFLRFSEISRRPFIVTDAPLLLTGPKRVHAVRVRGGNTKFRAMRLDSGVFSWGSECTLIALVWANMLKLMLIACCSHGSQDPCD